MLSFNGAAQRLNSSISTRFGATWTTNCGRSTAPGTDTGPEQGFIRVDVAHTAQQLLIEEGALDGRLAPAKERPKLFFPGLQRFHPTWVETTRMDAELAEHPRIDKPEFAAGGERGDQVSVFNDLSCRLAHHHAPGHAEMDDPLRFLLRRHGSPRLAGGGRGALLAARECSLQVKHDVLASAMDPDDPLAFERGSDGGG